MWMLRGIETGACKREKVRFKNSKSARLFQVIMLNPNDRPVPCPRSSAEVRRIWGDVTESQVDPTNGRFQLSPDGRVMRDTPYGRQQLPEILMPAPMRFATTPLSPIPPPTPSGEPWIPRVRGSRTIERELLKEELTQVEQRLPRLSEMKRLKEQLVLQMRMNEILSRALRMQLQSGE